MYAVNHLSIHVYDPSEPAFQGINNLIQYIYFFPHRPIMYPASLDVTTTNDLWQEVSPGKFHFQNISNGLVAFSGGGEVHVPNDQHAVAWFVF